MKKILKKSFFNKPVLKVAQNLIGKFLIRRYKTKETAYMIIEVEAYDGQKDLACHAKSGKTKRNKVMFGEAGRFYVYFTYGMHWMLNIVTGKKDYPAAVLIRGIEGILGPARLTKKLKIGKNFNGRKANKKTGLWFEDRGIKIGKNQILRAPRIGVDYAGAWAKKPYRFVLID